MSPLKLDQLVEVGFMKKVGWETVYMTDIYNRLRKYTPTS